MAISVNKLIYDFYRKLNSQNSGGGKKYAIADAVAYLNEAQEIWFENKVAATDENSKIRNDLRKFKEIKKCFDCVEVDCDCCRMEYPKDYYKRLNQDVLACNTECCGNIEKNICIDMPQSDDIKAARKDEVTKSDFKWERVIGDEAQNYLYIYHDGEMEIKQVCIDYYRKPKRIEAPELVKCRAGYEDPDGIKILQNQDFEVCETFANRDVTDIAVLLASRDSKDIESINTQLQKILQLNRLYRRVL